MISIKNLMQPGCSLINTAKYTLYPTDSANWSNFTPMQYNEISDFIAWSMQKAFCTLLKSETGHNGWYWSNGQMYQEYYNGKTMLCRCAIAVTANGILFLQCYDSDFNQVSQFVVKMK